jgi:hypothetical protein
MPVFRYTAVDSQCHNSSGQAEFPDKDSLISWLTENQLFLLTCDEVLPAELAAATSIENPVPMSNPAPLAAPVTASTSAPVMAREEGSRFQMPEMGFFSYVLMTGVFAICVFLGYLVGR